MIYVSEMKVLSQEGLVSRLDAEKVFRKQRAEIEKTFRQAHPRSRIA